jgi:hypothetical protein
MHSISYWTCFIILVISDQMSTGTFDTLDTVPNDRSFERVS